MHACKYTHTLTHTTAILTLHQQTHNIHLHSFGCGIIPIFVCVCGAAAAECWVRLGTNDVTCVNTRVYNWLNMIITNLEDKLVCCSHMFSVHFRCSDKLISQSQLSRYISLLVVVLNGRQCGAGCVCFALLLLLVLRLLKAVTKISAPHPVTQTQLGEWQQ